MKKFLFLLFFAITFITIAQQKGTLKGLVTDKEANNEPLPFANVILKGTTTGSTTDFDGNYIFQVPEGTHTVMFSFLGYKTITKTFTIKAGQTFTINQSMFAEEGVGLDEVIVRASTSNEKKEALILKGKNAVAITTAIGAQELAVKGVSDASGAVTKTVGVSKGSKNVVVRGLGDRYNSTTLNGLPLPSEDPEYKNIALDFFDTSIIQNIGVNKVFTSDLNGDVGGANINIVSKELTKNNTAAIGFGLGGNSQTLAQDFLTIDGTNKFGTQKATHAISDFSSYNFDNSFQPNSQNLQLNNSFSFNYGKKFILGDNSLSVFLVGGYDAKYTLLEGYIQQNSNGGFVFRNQDFSKYTFNVSQLLMGNVKFNADKFSLAYNHLFIHNNKQSIGDYLGIDDPQQEGDVSFLRRQQTNNNELYVNQLIGKYDLTERLAFEAKGALNFIRGNEPDRRTNEYLVREGVTRPNTNSDGTNERFFAKLQENDYAAKGKLSYKLSSNEDDISTLDLGADYRYTERLFSATIFNHRFSGNGPEIDSENPDAIFNQNSIDTNIFELTSLNVSAANPDQIVPFTYRGKKLISGVFSNLTLQLSEQIIVSGGLKFERAEQRVTFATNIASSTTDGPSFISRTYILPNFNLKYTLDENNIFRFAGSQTYTYPQFKEIAPFKYQDVNFSSQGNPNLIPSDNYNFDVKYEHYLSSGELFAITGFFKHIQNPISRTEISSAGNTLTYLNVGDNASVFGLELEAVKTIFQSGDYDENDYKIDLGFNASYLNSNVNLDDNSIAQFTSGTSQLEGATPILINTDLSFNQKFEDSELTATVVFNYFSDRVYSIGTRGFENIIEKGIPTLDFVTNYKLGKHYRFKLKATNLLNPSFQLNRDNNGADNIVLSNYKKGVNLSLGVSYNF